MDEIRRTISSTLYHLVFFILISVVLVMAAVGISKFDETIADYTGHQLWKFIVEIIYFAVPLYVFWNWISDIYRINEHDISRGFFTVGRLVKTFVSGGIKAIGQKKKEDL